MCFECVWHGLEFLRTHEVLQQAEVDEEEHYACDEQDENHARKADDELYVGPTVAEEGNQKFVPDCLTCLLLLQLAGNHVDEVL